MNETRLKHRRILITEAGSGIGRALAESTISAGADTTLSDKNADSVTEMASVAHCVSQKMDLSDPEAWAKVPCPALGWDFVALNAGVMTALPDARPEESDFFTMKIGRDHQVMRVNVDDVVHGVRRVLPDLADGGAIVATASAAGVAVAADR